MQFLFPSLAAGFLLVLLPLGIHLINLMRQRRVAWGAMEFLLAAHRKQRRWIWLRQFLLLALRMLVIAAVVAMLAHLVGAKQWARFLGGQTTHHVVLIDDSFSMTDAGVLTPFERAQRFLSRLGEAMRGRNRPERLTVIRFSRAEGVHPADPSSPPPAKSGQNTDAAASITPETRALEMLEIADLGGIPVDGDFSTRLAECQGRLRPSALSIGPEAALQAASAILAGSPRERGVIYLLSDFRADPWDHPAESLRELRTLTASGHQAQLVRCADEAHANLVLSDLRPTDGIRVAGVPVVMEATVTNHGPAAARDVTISIREHLFPPVSGNAAPGTLPPQSRSLPAIQVELLEPGKSATMKFQTLFPTGGYHALTAELPADSILLDNRRYAVLDLKENSQVLVVDGDPAQQNLRFLSHVFEPSPRVRTGIRTIAQPAAYLRDASPAALAAFDAIYLLDVPSLDERARGNVERFAQEGGGVAFFLGPNANLDFYREWYRGGEGFFPVSPERTEALGPTLVPTPDVSIENHPLFRVFLGERNPFLDQVRIRQYIRASLPERVPDASISSAPKVLAKLRSGRPLLVERQVGEGRVVCLLTSLDPAWNVWRAQLSFAVFFLDLQSYLGSSGRMADSSQLVGGFIPYEVSSTDHAATLEMQMSSLALELTPLTDSADAGNGPASNPRASAAPVPIEQIAPEAPAETGSEARVRFDLSGPRNAAGDRITDHPGIVEIWLRAGSAPPEVRRLALNVSATEGDLTLAEPNGLAEKIAANGCEWLAAEEAVWNDSERPGGSWRLALWLLVLGLLVMEQALAFANSYHAAPRKGIA